MCGIVGVVLKNNSGFFKQSEETFADLLFADTLRGDDATGIIAVDKDASFSIAKEATPAPYFIPSFMSGKIAREMFKSGKLYIGHNRKATHGKAGDDKNAHPFVVQNEFALVHNGTLYNHRQLAETDVDSEALAIVLCQAFEKADYKTALEEVLGKVTGAYALAGFDQRTNKAFLLRNKERPLAIAEATNGWYFASEPAMLYWILGRNGFSESDMKVRMVPSDTLLTFELNEYKQTVLHEEVLVPKKPYTQSTAWTKTGEDTTKSSKNTHKNKEISSNTVETFSRNSWKRFKRNWLGKRIEFWADDYVEEAGPNGPTIAQGATKVYLMGECDQFTPLNIVQCLVDIKDLNVDIQSLDNYLFSGRIYDLEWDTDADMLTVRVESVNRVLGPNRKSTQNVINGVWIKEKIDAEEANKAEEERNSQSNQSTLH